MPSNATLKTLIVDDSTFIRNMLARALAKEPDIQVVGGAGDAKQARDQINELSPDVLILDIEMPGMDGLSFLSWLMQHRQIPVIVCSGLASNSKVILDALERGAVDVVAKPSGSSSDGLLRLSEELAHKIRAAAVSRRIRAAAPPPANAASSATTFAAAGLNPRQYMIALGASTGGTEAIKSLLSCVPADWPPVVIVQHMPEAFTASFAKRLDDFSPLRVTEAVAGDELVPGRALLARGNIQMMVRRTGVEYRIAYGTSEPVNRHCPSVDVLFDSVAELNGRKLIGILLTGMGADGAAGLLRPRQAGAITIAQNAESCVVYGMPAAAEKLGAVQYFAPPEEIPSVLLRALAKKPATAAAR